MFCCSRRRDRRAQNRWNMRKEHFEEILRRHLNTSAKILKLGNTYVSSKRAMTSVTAKLVLKWPEDYIVNVFEWPFKAVIQISLRIVVELKTCVQQMGPTNLTHLRKLHKLYQDK
ncbi:hypothetical protein ILYODFUR_026654 [Ilyodon furcidens]|uniref:Uncharacterized protein n=1 Tax=Ilyodon furcidens TaxID=33524 RepID=A0ABV0TYI0_9TELE